MTEYIENPLSGKLRGVTYEDGKIIDVHIRDTDDVVKVFVPVRHGRWIFGKDLPYSWGQIIKNKYHLYCSECLEQAFNRSEDNDPDFDVDTPYCPVCGCRLQDTAVGRGLTQEKLQTFVPVAARK